MAPLLRLWHYARAHRSRLLLAVLFSVLNKLADLTPPFLIGIAVDTVVTQQNSLLSRLFGFEDTMTQLWVLAGITLLAWGLESITEYIFLLLWRNLAQTVQHELRLETYDHVQHLELAYFEDQSTGGLMSILNDDINQLERFLDVGINDLLQLVTTIIALSIFFFVTAPGLAWLALLPIPIIVWGSLRYQKKMEPMYAAVREQVGLLNTQLSNNLSGVATVKSFTAGEAEVARIGAVSDAYRLKNREAIRYSAAFVPLIRMAIVLGFMATLVYGGFLSVSGAISVGVYSTLVFMTQRLLWPLTRLGQTLDLYQRAMASTRRVFGLLDTEPQMRDGDQSLALEGVRGNLELKKVSFAYQDSAPVISDLSLNFPAGETTAIIGATGAGKSTIIKLLLRFYDPDKGSVTLDDYDLRSLSRTDVRSTIGLVSQDVFLFHGSVRDNIAYGAPGADDEAIRRAAEIAEAHFIEALPQGYDTVVGERGQKLSGGQRQRISIARAILKDPPILILDEATSAVDNETEAAIQRSLARIAKNRTMVLIAHRLSTVRSAERIYVLEGGRLAEQGKHEQLVAQNGLYAKLWRVQTGERAREAHAAD